MTINIINADDVSRKITPEEQSKIDEAKKVMDQALVNFFGVVGDLTMDTGSLLDYINKHNIRKMLEDMTLEMENLKKETSNVNMHPADIRTAVGFFGVSCMCLYEKALRNLVECENKEKAEFVTFAKMLRKQLQIVDGQDVERDDIAAFINGYMPRILDAMNAGNIAKTSEEVPTTFATELEALEETA